MSKRSPFPPANSPLAVHQDALLASWRRAYFPETSDPSEPAARYWSKVSPIGIPSWPPAEVVEASKSVVRRGNARWSLSPKLALAVIGVHPKEYRLLSLRKRTTLLHMGLSRSVDKVAKIAPADLKDTRPIKWRLIKACSHLLPHSLYGPTFSQIILNAPPEVLDEKLTGPESPLSAKDMLHISRITGVPGYSFVRHASEVQWVPKDDGTHSTYMTWNAARNLCFLDTGIEALHGSPKSFLERVGGDDYPILIDDVKARYDLYVMALRDLAEAIVMTTTPEFEEEED